MPATATLCPRNHEIRTEADRDGQGHCRQCERERAKRNRVSNSMKLAMVRAFEDAGVSFEADDGSPVEPVEVVRQLVAIFEDSL